MNRDDITYSTPDYENEADRNAQDESPLRLGETGAGLGWGDMPSTLTEADRKHLDAINTFRAKKGWELMSEAEYPEYASR